jgi:hypothetical protein
MMVQVFLTFDTECSLGGAWENASYRPVHPDRAILGKMSSGCYGTPRIMDLLEENGLRGVFFIEVFASLNGYQSELAAAYSEILRRGHDVQLHLHPVQYYYWLLREGEINRDRVPADKDMIGALAPETQLELLQKGVSLFENLVGRAPTAFRAGNFGASNTTLGLLEKVGIRFDSSFNASYLRAGCKLDSGGTINVTWPHGTLLEVPVTNFEVGPPGIRGLKQLNINAVSLWEMISVLEQAEKIGLPVVNFIGHSFSLFKFADPQFLKIRPDRLVLRRFQGLCRFLKEHASRFSVSTFANMQTFPIHAAETAIPRLGTVVPVLRKAVQAVNRLYWI